MYLHYIHVVVQYKLDFKKAEGILYLAEYLHLPVRHQCIFLPSEHNANIGCMVDGRIEVCVVT